LRRPILGATLSGVPQGDEAPQNLNFRSARGRQKARDEVESERKRRW
jgi:hypothetical protein